MRIFCGLVRMTFSLVPYGYSQKIGFLCTLLIGKRLCQHILKSKMTNLVTYNSKQKNLISHQRAVSLLHLNLVIWPTKCCSPGPWRANNQCAEGHKVNSSVAFFQIIFFNVAGDTDWLTSFSILTNLPESLSCYGSPHCSVWLLLLVWWSA